MTSGMGGYATLSVSRDRRGVARVVLNRPDKRNALSAAMIAELTALAADFAADPPRVAVLEGAGAVFCAGGDLDWMRDQIAADRAGRMAAARALARMLQALNTLPCPLIGRIHGGAFGGGVGLACICDLAIAEAAARFGLTETRLGLIPATIAPYVAARIGEGAARRVALSAHRFDASEAQALGIVARVVPAGALDGAIEDAVAPFLAAAPGAVAAAKRLFRALGRTIDEAVIDDTIGRLADTWEQPEAQAGIAAFFDRRPPPWV